MLNKTKIQTILCGKMLIAVTSFNNPPREIIFKQGNHHRGTARGAGASATQTGCLLSIDMKVMLINYQLKIIIIVNYF